MTRPLPLLAFIPRFIGGLGTGELPNTGLIVVATISGILPIAAAGLLLDTRRGLVRLADPSRH